MQQNNELHRQIIKAHEGHSEDHDLLKIKLTASHELKVQQINAAHEERIEGLAALFERHKKILHDQCEKHIMGLQAKHNKAQVDLKDELEQKAEDKHRELRQANQKLAIETKSLRKKVEGYQAMKTQFEPLREEVGELRMELAAVKKDLVAANAQLSKQKAKVIEVQVNKQTISDLEVELSVAKKSLSATKAQLLRETNNSQEAQNHKNALLEELEAANKKLAVANKGIDTVRIQLSDSVKSSKKTTAVLQDKLALAEKDLKSSKVQISKGAEMLQEIQDKNEYLIRGILMVAVGSKFLGESGDDMKEGVKKLGEDKEDIKRLVELGCERVERLQGEVQQLRLKLESGTKEPLVEKGVGIRERFLKQQATDPDHSKLE
ncbi:hypothetical protein BDZ45DRAFT_673668 [Acephala macrosclerotiorum]|nr:hypothetical protein BDZ45DRAFT_673668 [Acephala macrosclerotiorum]